MLGLTEAVATRSFVEPSCRPSGDGSARCQRCQSALADESDERARRCAYRLTLATVTSMMVSDVTQPSRQPCKTWRRSRASVPRPCRGWSMVSPGSCPRPAPRCPVGDRVPGLPPERRRAQPAQGHLGVCDRPAHRGPGQPVLCRCWRAPSSMVARRHGHAAGHHLFGRGAGARTGAADATSCGAASTGCWWCRPVMTTATWTRPDDRGSPWCSSIDHPAASRRTRWSSTMSLAGRPRGPAPAGAWSSADRLRG